MVTPIERLTEDIGNLRVLMAQTKSTVDNIAARDVEDRSRIGELDRRIGALERWRYWTMGAAAGLGALAGYLSHGGHG